MQSAEEFAWEWGVSEMHQSALYHATQLRDAEWQARVEKLEAALKGALREHGSCDWNGCWCQDARAALGGD